MAKVKKKLLYHKLDRVLAHLEYLNTVYVERFEKEILQSQVLKGTTGFVVSDVDSTNWRIDDLKEIKRDIKKLINGKKKRK